MKNTTAWRVGCGDKFKFWEDAWMGGEEPLLARFPMLYSISTQQHQSIQHMGAIKDAGWEWDFRWRRPLFDSEVDLAVSFLTDVTSHPIQPHKTDQWVWKADPGGQYTAKSAYYVFRGEIVEQQQDGAFEELWKIKLPSKIVIFAWRLIRDRLPTKVNLRRRQIQLGDSRCPFCGVEEESAGHLFFLCRKIIPIWWESLSWVNLSGAFPNHPRHHFLQHIYGVTEGMRSSRWKWWWMALTWTIWKHRNTIIFSNGSFNANGILDDTIFLLWTWLTNLEKDFNTHYNYWSSNIRAGFLNRIG